MLNYILPPIVIIASLAVLIMFLFRKADQVPVQEFSSDENSGKIEKGVKKVMPMIGEFVLKLLERMMHRSKLWSLKFHNVSNAWFQTIREKRQRDARIKNEILEQNIKTREEFERSEQKKIEEAHHKAVLIEKKQPMRPMVSVGATMPQQAKIKEKNKLEDVLIKRIAINPRDIEAYERLGDYYLESENFHDSLECFKQVLLLSPTHHKARLRIKRLERIK